MIDQWVILELSSKADGEDPDLIRKSITYMIRGAEVFIPAAVTQVGEDRVVHYLVEGYAFIRHTFTDAVYNKLENSKYVSNVVTRVARVANGRSVRQLGFISTADVDRMKRQIQAETDQGIGVHDTVLITSGAYKQIQAKVIEDLPEEDKVQVRVMLRSKDTIVSLPRSFLKLVEKAPKPPALDRFQGLKEWFNQAHDLSHSLKGQLEDSFGRVQDGFQVYGRYADWVAYVDTGTAFVRAFYVPLDLTKIQNLGKKNLQIWTWADRWETLVPTVQGGSVSLPSMSPVETKYLQLMTVLSFLEHMESLEAAICEIEDEMSIEVTAGVQNVIVDGFNLAYRCFYAPGMSDMRDIRGRHTGVLFGFVRVLASLLKKFPGTRLYVVWDGSNKRRKAMFTEYKANRSKEFAVSADSGGERWDQVLFLQGLLPLLGVTQAYNPEEEADDVIASLVRGELRGQQNVVLSTDHDLMQLITETDRLLLPTQGKRKESLYDLVALRDGWGVGPDKIVSLRAMLGDTSDNIPGIPTVPQKVLTDLLQLYGSIDGIYASNLAGLTKKRYECVRQSEKQVRLNLDLMTLREVPIQRVAAVPDPQSASNKLSDVDVQAETLLSVFFPGHSGEV